MSFIVKTFINPGQALVPGGYTVNSNGDGSVDVNSDGVIVMNFPFYFIRSLNLGYDCSLYSAVFNYSISTDIRSITSTIRTITYYPQPSIDVIGTYQSGFGISSGTYSGVTTVAVPVVDSTDYPRNYGLIITVNGGPSSGRILVYGVEINTIVDQVCRISTNNTLPGDGVAQIPTIDSSDVIDVGYYDTVRITGSQTIRTILPVYINKRLSMIIIGEKNIVFTTGGNIAKQYTGEPNTLVTAIYDGTYWFFQGCLVSSDTGNGNSSGSSGNSGGSGGNSGGSSGNSGSNSGGSSGNSGGNSGSSPSVSSKVK